MCRGTHHPDKHNERAVTDMEEQVWILSNDQVEFRRYLGLMEEELLMPLVAKLCKSPEKLPEAPATKEHTNTLPTATTPTMEFYKCSWSS